MHPHKVLNWIFRSYSEVGTQRTMILAILAAYKLLNMKAIEKASYAVYLEQCIWNTLWVYLLQKGGSVGQQVNVLTVTNMTILLLIKVCNMTRRLTC